ncbi:reverse transcriptase domain-containing protein [Tanacetum coccineum]
MAEEDEEKTALVTSQGIFCYLKMSFRLKNVRATYQRLVDKAFQKQTGQNLEVYVDDLVIKSRMETEVIRDTEETFKTRREINMKLNPKKCAFGMREGTFLGYKVDADELREVISAVLMTERDGKQMPIYFVSRALQGLEVNYTPMEKLILALLEEHDIHYRPRSVKGQILADFIVERLEEDPIDTQMEDKEELLDPWVLFTDRSSCIDGSGTGLIITNPEGVEFTYALRFGFNVTNNEAKYEALIAGLRIEEQIGGENKKADTLNKIASTSFAHLSKQVLVEELKEKSINEDEVLAVVEEEGHTWMTLIYEYLMEEIIPEEKRKARVIRRKAGRYAVSNGILYKKSFLRPWLRYVGPLQANYVLREIHEGSCSMHAGPRSVVAKVFRSAYYWPTMHSDARNLIRECSSCQSSNEETPFSLTYEANAVILVEIGMPTLRTMEADMIKNNEALGINLDLLEERIEQTAI